MRRRDRPIQPTGAGRVPDDFDRAIEREGLRLDDDGVRGWTAGRIVSAILVAAIAGFWIWAFSPWAPRGHPDELDSPAFADAARPLCAAAVAELNELPLAREVRSMDERADLLDSGSAIYRRLVAELRDLAPDPDTRDGDIVGRWLDDYEIYLADRDAYAADFRAGIDEPFSVTTKGRYQITEPLDEFAAANDIRDCATPGDA